jgi:hypothetical protein
LLGFYGWLLALFTAGRWSLSLSGADYYKTTGIFSLATLALLCSANHGAFARAYEGYSWKEAAALGATIGVVTQIVIFSSTVISYALGLETFWNFPRALNQTTAVPLGTALVVRSAGVVIHFFTNAIAAMIGFAMGGALKAAGREAR